MIRPIITILNKLSYILLYIYYNLFTREGDKSESFTAGF